MFYIVQENIFSEPGYDSLIIALDKIGLEYETVKVDSSNEIEFKTDRKDVFVFGGTKLARIGRKLDWNPGVILNENHDYLIYKEHYKENLLNYDSKIYKFDEDFEWKRKYYFIRPCLDSKLFTGALFCQPEWEERKAYIQSNEPKRIVPDTMIQVATQKYIQTETRFWIVGGKIISGSTYKQGNMVLYNEVVDGPAYDFCKKMIDVFQLADAFTMDIAMCNDEYYIVECGCINCSGFYKCNTFKLLIAVEEYFNGKC